MLLRNYSVAVCCVLLAVAPAVQSQFNFTLDLDTDNLIPEWLPQCFDGVSVFNPGAVVECVQAETAPACLEGKSTSDLMTEVVDCITSSIGEDVIADMMNLPGLPTTTAESRQGDGGGNALDEASSLIEGWVNDVIGINSESGGLMNIAGVFVNATLDCLNPYADCVNETIQVAVANLNPCMETTLLSLVQCGRTNNATCLTTCENNLPATNPFMGLDLDQTSTCDQIQGNIMDPLCSIVDCCEPCVAQVEDLMECVINQQLDQVPLAGGDCDMACPAVPERRLRRQLQSPTPVRTLQATTDYERHDNDCLQFAPGLTGGDSAELSARSAVFLECSYDTFLRAIEDPGVPMESTIVATDNEDADIPTESATTEGNENADAATESAGTNSNGGEQVAAEVENVSSGSMIGSGFAFAFMALLFTIN